MNQETILPVRIARRTPDPVFPKVERHIFMVRAEDLPEGMPKGSNPREQNIDRMVWKEIGRHLLNHSGVPNTFHLKNKGITVVASQVQRLDDDRIRLIFASEHEGIVDGGHTYELIQNNKEIIDLHNADDDNELINQFVKVEVITGLDQDTVPEIAGGLNTGIQVSTHSLANLEDKFLWIKRCLGNEPYARSIMYRENENKPIDVRQILQFMECLNLTDYPNNGREHPVRAYSSRERLVQHYVKHPAQYEALEPVLKDVLRLYDTIQYEARGLYNEAVTNAKAGKFVFFEKRERGTHEFHFIQKTDVYRLHRAAALPMLGAFRALLELDPATGKARWVLPSFGDVLTTWRAMAPELIDATKETSTNNARKLHAIGRDKTYWKTLHQTMTIARLERA